MIFTKRGHTSRIPFNAVIMLTDDLMRHARQVEFNVNVVCGCANNGTAGAMMRFVVCMIHNNIIPNFVLFVVCLLRKPADFVSGQSSSFAPAPFISHHLAATGNANCVRQQIMYIVDLLQRAT